MSETIIVVTYIILMPILLGVEIYILKNDKGKYLRTSYKGLQSILKIENRDKYWLADEIELFYFRYSQEKPVIKKFFLNVIVWIDSIILRIDLDYGYTKDLKKIMFYLKK